MSEIEGIKDFIEENKQSLENMNQEMIASRGHVPLVWLTVNEAEGIWETIEEAKEFLWKYHKVPLTELGQKDFDTLKNRIERAKTGNE